MKIIVYVCIAAVFIADFSNSQTQDLPRGPWHLVFKAVHNKTSGRYDDFYDLYQSNDTLNEHDVAVRKDFSAESSAFKSSLLQDWTDKKISVQAVKFSFFKNGTEQQYIVFDAQGKGKFDWLDCTKILYSSYSDITTINPATCRWGGGASQRFAIKVQSLESTPCADLTGWIYSRDRSASYYQCQSQWPDTYDDRPFFLYATGNEAASFKTGMTKADSIAIFLQVWDTVFNGVAGQDPFLHLLWKSAETKNARDHSAKVLESSSLQTYKSSMVNVWSNYFLDTVKYSQYLNGKEVAYVVFDGRNSTKMDWFDEHRIKYSNYIDIHDEKSVCSIEGDGIRRWQIQKTSGNCSEDTAWMQVLDDTNTSTPCPWDKQSGKPYFLYSKLSHAAKLVSGGSVNSVDIKRADVMAVFVRGWHLVFKVSSNGALSGASSVLDLWTSAMTANENETDMASVLAGNLPYKSDILKNWSNYDIRAVKMALHVDGQETAYVVFDATGTRDVSAVFDCKRILHTSYTDLSANFNGICGVAGESSEGRIFAITDTATDCNTKRGWFVVLDKTNKGTCPWESTLSAQLPQFLYSDEATNTTIKDMKQADSFAIFVDMDVCVTSPCNNGGECENVAGGYYCHCTGEYFGRTCSDRNGGYSEWGNWSTCSVTCGDGKQNRSRVCDNPKPEGNGVCVGDMYEIRDCSMTPCPINGNWSDWGAWSNCSADCGGGNRSRSRICDNPEPQYGGANCTGDETETGSCNETPCPIDGGLSEWSNWTDCSVTCGPGGVELRIRQCNNPTPQYGGKNCTGELQQSRNCSGINETCPPVDGSWGTWFEWGSCSRSCDGGFHTRNRTCSDPVPAWGGNDCTGNNVEIGVCNKMNCSSCDPNVHEKCVPYNSGTRLVLNMMVASILVILTYLSIKVQIYM